MRVRHKKWAAPYIKAHRQYLTDRPREWRGRWNERFKNRYVPLVLEIGTGKGQFISEIARRNPRINYIGIEIETSVIAMALRKVVNGHLTNVQLINANGNQIQTFFTDHSIDGLYLNFSDPWPKRRHAKRRLTSSRFLPCYQRILKNRAPIKFKTDNRNFFEYSLKSFNNYGLKFDDVCLDLHHSPENLRNVPTEYEDKFSSKGPIYRAVVHFENQK